MAAIERRTTASGARYDVRYRDPSGRLRRRTFKRMAEARAFSRSVEVDKIRGDWTDPARAKVTFGDWWESWWPSTINLRPSTRARDESYARCHLLPHFGVTPLGAIDHTAVSAWVASLSASGLAPATVVKAGQILGKALTAAVHAGMIGRNPAANVKLPKVERREMNFLTPGQVNDLADAIDPRYRAFVLTAAYTGLRFGEMAALVPERVDLLHRRLHVLETVAEVRGHHHVGPPKTSAGRRAVPLPRVVVDALGASPTTLAGELVFPAPDGGHLRASLFRRRVWQPACLAAGVGSFVNDEGGTERYRGLRIHDLRHTAVAFWIAAGASPNEVAARAGHASVVTVLDRYGHLLPGHEEKVNAALDAMAAGAHRTHEAAAPIARTS